MKRLIQIFVFSLLIAFSTAPSVNAGVGDFTIEGYHVDIKVTAQNTYRIQETIKVNFPGQRHGIYRDIPLVNTHRWHGAANLKIGVGIDAQPLILDLKG